MANSWITHVKAYAAKHKMPYGKAISAARASYKKGSGTASAGAAKKAKMSSRKPDVKRATKKGAMETAVLDDKKIKFRKGGLKKSLKVGEDYTFKRSELNKLKKIEVGETFDFHKKKMKMTSKLKKQITLGLNLMKK
tara:strand:+ start:1620 stop:2030 length:411 start_codon:yes stop_codon:yes gene_type:complete